MTKIIFLYYSKKENNKGIMKTCFNILEEKVQKYILLLKHYGLKCCVTFDSKFPILGRIIIPARIKKVLAGIMKLVFSAGQNYPAKIKPTCKYHILCRSVTTSIPGSVSIQMKSVIRIN